MQLLLKRMMELTITQVLRLGENAKMIMRQRDGSEFTLSPKTQEIEAASAVDLDASYVALTGPAAGTYAITLDEPTVEGQVMVIEMVATTGTNSVTMALTNVVGGVPGTASFDAAGEILVLVSSGSAWVVLKEVGVTLA